jgi:hypothetical protein
MSRCVQLPTSQAHRNVEPLLPYRNPQLPQTSDVSHLLYPALIGAMDISVTTGSTLYGP